MKTIKEFISGCALNIHAKAMLIIWTLGDWNEKRKTTKAKKQYQKALNQFSFVLSPTEVFDRLVIFKGAVYRIQFEKEGFIVRNELDETFIEDPLLIIQLLNEIKQK